MNSDAGARGVPDLSANSGAGKEEKAASRDTTLNDKTKPPVRGPGKNSSRGIIAMWEIKETSPTSELQHGHTWWLVQQRCS